MIAADVLIEKSVNLQELPRLLFVHIRKTHTLKQKPTLTSSQKLLERAYFNGLVPHGKLWAHYFFAH